MLYKTSKPIWVFVRTIEAGKYYIEPGVHP